MRSSRTGKTTLWGLSLAACVLIAIVAVKANEPNPNPEFTVDRTPITRQEGGTLSYSPVIKKVRPSIVSISTSKTVEVQDMFGGQGLIPDDLFRRFFGDRGFNQPQQRENPKQKRTGLGSGFIVTPDGYILTNNHVVEGGDEIKVTLSDSDTEYDAKVVGGDPRSDIAILKIEATGLPVVTLGDSDLIEDGDVVLAFGNPFGIGQTVTMGIVSATGRKNLGIEEYENFIQTDAAINPGNSGGALTDALGRVIGINTAIYSRSGGNQGIGFAIPVNMAENIMKQIISTGKVTRGYLGVTLQKLTDDLVEEFGLKGKTGALITEVREDSAAAKVGIKTGDVIIAVNGKEAKDMGTLRLMISSIPPGENTTLKIVRDGQEKDIVVVLDEWPEGLDSYGTTSVDGNSQSPIKGVTVKNLSDELRKDAQIPEKIEGVFVSEVAPDSSAYESGLMAGDIIMECNGNKTKTVADLKSALGGRDKNRLLVYSHSRSVTRFVVIKK